MNTHVISELAWTRMWAAPASVRCRLLRATTALASAEIPYAVCGSQAVMAWVSSVDESAVRYAQKIEILLCGAAHKAATEVLDAAGFGKCDDVPARVMDRIGSNSRAAVDLLLVEDAHAKGLLQTPTDLSNVVEFESMKVLSLEPLLYMLLSSCKTNDRVDIRDLIDVGLIDESWVSRFPSELGSRLRHIIKTPDG